MSYRIPQQAVFKLLYEGDQTDSGDINEKIRPVLNDRIARILVKTNTTNMSRQREQINRQIKQAVQESLHELFGLEVIDLQISEFRYS